MKALFSQLNELESVSKTLQAENCSLADVRLLFDSVVEKHPVVGEYLLPTARINHSPVFESAVVNVINEQPLTGSESRSVLSFATEVDLAPARPVGGDDFATSVLRQAKKPRRIDSGIVVYKPLLKLIPPTSNHCERLFSQCKLILTSQRQDLLPANFEMLSFLRANRKMWGPSSLAEYNERDV
uniref:AlNc14C13G1599 protein n=1 Tax=Albugo laibachii Nc14 TaxID=890382 RepID=F0W3N9_9STRA|nr:AlNc14C13G1599 [Albugo laibachii Nc14]|eukprot:CCA15682.1 AlNc14C13G1599 [Albugo laibachii Nc14]